MPPAKEAFASLLARNDRATRITALALAVAVIPLIAWADCATGANVAFTLLYLAPIAATSWYSGLFAGTLAAALCTFSWLWADVITRQVQLHPVIFAWNGAVEATVFMAFVLLLAGLRRRLEIEQQLAATDPLTGLPNRRAFLIAAHVELERAQRLGQPLTVAYLDLDGFKALNDRLGHQAGDSILSAMATRLRAVIRAFDLPVRVGGDEFAVLFPGLGPKDAPELLVRLHRDVVEQLRQQWDISLSCGAVTFLSAPASVEEMVAQADRVMYDVKRGGKNAVRHEVSA